MPQHLARDRNIFLEKMGLLFGGLASFDPILLESVAILLS